MEDTETMIMDNIDLIRGSEIEIKMGAKKWKEGIREMSLQKKKKSGMVFVIKRRK